MRLIVSIPKANRSSIVVQTVHYFIAGVVFVVILLLIPVLSGGGAATAQTPAPDNYTINVGDELEFDILDDDAPPQRFVIGSDGLVQLPFIGGVRVASLPVGEAREMIRRTYVDREIFISPGIDLSIASFRPIFVLGDVKQPGNYDYQPFLTAEQAVGLAGGPAVFANNEEARILEKRNIEGTLDELEYDLALLSAQFARVQAQLVGLDSAQWSSVPQEIRSGVNRELFDEHKTREDQIIRLEAADLRTRRELLEDGVAEAERRIGLMDQREVVLEEMAAMTAAESERQLALADKGLVPKADANATAFSVGRAENELLQVREQRSQALLQLADLRGQLSGFDTTRENTLLTQAQAFRRDISKTIATRDSLEDRLGLIRQWMSAAAGLEAELLIEFKVRRRTGGEVVTLSLAPYDELVPGDLLVVVVKPPEGHGDSG
ncbi:polysaccharide biosynthesis/export family protein [Aliiruegeria lutimaris]|uniref:Exopolysaccharide production protein ExoF n=1 Tax=Aliiruegeria lutimaris TaxID=571298 RepID=A0A1G9P0S5_9RHOB|nr:polysaccharide biosynthesis/export family protein [Aliiruegeria lutimaris]SDL92244.1 exopolysaccharide production protein ExoF [Aliiruegeria lutimaris]